MEFTECVICKGEFTEKSSHKHLGVCSHSCFIADFWLRWVKEKEDPKIARIGHRHFYMEDENKKGGFRGYGGSKFIIKYNDGKVVVTTNLWCQGGIPENLWSELPDNAEFIKDVERVADGVFR